MALTIEGATVGYDSAGVKQLSNDIKTEQIDEAITNLDKNFETLTTAVDDIWAGRAAENFKTNMKTDVEKLKAALNATHAVLDSELNQIVKAMGNVDQELVEKR